MSINLAIPTFVSGAKADVAAPDIYKLDTTAKINNISAYVAPPEDIATASTSTSLKDKLKSGLDFIKAGLPIAKGITSILDISKNLSGGTSSILARLASAAPGLSSALKSLSLPNLSGMLTGLGSSAGALAKIGDVVKKVGSGNYNDIASIGGAINTITGDTGTFQLIDSAASIGALAGVCTSAIKAGIPNSFSALAGTLNNIGSINSLAGKTLDTVLKNSDSSSLMCMSTMTTEGAMKMIKPDVVQCFAKDYAIPEGTPENKLPEMFTEFKTGLTKLDDSSFSCTRLDSSNNPEIITDLTNIQGSSPDFTKVIRYGALSSPLAEDKLLLLAPAFPKVSPMDEIKVQFPETIIDAIPEKIPSTGTSFLESFTPPAKTINPETIFTMQNVNPVGGILATTSGDYVGDKFIQTMKYAMQDGTFKYKTVTSNMDDVVISTTWS